MPGRLSTPRGRWGGSLGVYDRENANGATILHCAAEGGHAKEVDATLRMPKLDREYTVAVDAPTGNGSTALYVAAHGGHAAAVRRLLRARASPHLKRQDGCTPSVAAARGGHTEVLHQVSLEQGTIMA